MLDASWETVAAGTACGVAFLVLAFTHSPLPTESTPSVCPQCSGTSIVPTSGISAISWGVGYACEACGYTVLTDVCQF